MGKKISEDEIKWILSVESTQAQQKIHQLITTNKELIKTNKDYSKAQTELVQNGKKKTQEYKNLSEAITVNNAKIKSNAAEIKNLESTLGLSALTMSQLRNKAKDLQFQLNGTSKALNPAEYAKLEKELKGVHSRMNELKDSSKNVSSGFASLKDMLPALGLAAVAAALTSLFKSSVDGALAEEESLRKLSFAIKQVGGGSDSDLAKVAKQAEDLQGIFAHEDIEGAATSMINYGLSVNQVTSIMPDLVSAAAQSGFSLEDLATAVDKGSTSGVIARSALGKLGMSFKDTGDRAENFRLIQEGLTKFTGGNTAAMEAQWGTMKNLKIRWDEAKEALGSFLLKGLVPVAKGLADIAINTQAALTPAKSMTEQFKDQTEKVINLKTNISPLLDRYDELSTKAKKSASENDELKRIIKNVTDVMPGAVTAVDAYGNAISMSTSRVRTFINTEVARYKVVNKDAITENKKALKQTEEDLIFHKKRIESINKTGTFLARVETVKKTGDQYDIMATPEQVATEQKVYKELLNTKVGYVAQIEFLNGTTLEKEIDAAKKKADLDEANAQREAKYNAMTKAELLKLIKAKDDYAKTIYDKRFVTDESGKDKKDPFKEKVEQLDKELLAEQVSEKQKKQSKEELDASLLALDEKYITAKRNLYKKDTAEYNGYQNQLLDIDSNNQDAGIKAQLDNMDKNMLAEQVKLKQSHIDGVKTDEQYNTDLLDLQILYLQKKRDLYKKDSAEYNNYEDQLIDIDSNKKKDANAAQLKVIQDSYKAIQTATDTYEQLKKRELQDSLDNGTKKQEEYNSQIVALDVVVAERRLQDAKDYSELISTAKYNSEAEKTKAVQTATDSVNAANAVLLKAQQAVNKNKLQEEKNHLDKVAKLRQELGLDKEKLSYKAGLEALKIKLKAAEASEKETADAIAEYKAKKYEQYAGSAVALTKSVTDAVSAYHDAEAGSLEAAKQRELTAAGNNADARQAIEEKYAQKELDLKKKQADANMGIAIAQAIAEGALGIAKIWAVEGVNPILAGILTAGLIAVTGAQIASAVQQRNVINGTTLTVSSSSSSAASGSMTATGLEDGGSIDVTRAQDGKLFKNATYDPNRRGFVDRPTVIVGEGKRSKEWIASNAAVSNPTVAPIIALLDKHQQAGTIRTLDLGQAIRANAAGFASGGYISKPIKAGSSQVSKSTDQNDDLIDTIKNFSQIMTEIKENGITADVSLTDLERKQNLKNKSRKIGTKK